MSVTPMIGILVRLVGSTVEVAVVFKDRTSDIGYPRPFTSSYPPPPPPPPSPPVDHQPFNHHMIFSQQSVSPSVRQSVSYYTDEIFEAWSRDKFFRDFFRQHNIIISTCKQQQQQEEEELLRVSRGLVVGRAIEVRKVSII